MASTITGLRPLYQQVYDHLVSQVAEGKWLPGTALPSEQALAAQLGVSQGTVRKALDALSDTGLMERRQGKGTFVARNTQERNLFRFFRLSRPGGERVTPQPGEEAVITRTATAREVARLDLIGGAQVVEIKRSRLIDGTPILFEIIILPAVVFPEIELVSPLPNTLYSLYQSQYGVNIVTANEELKADLATAEDAKYLGVPVGAPILQIDRIAIGLDGNKVEWRMTRCNSADYVFAVTLS